MAMSKLFYLRANPDNRKFELLLDGRPIKKVNEFLKSLELRGLSQHTIRAYGYDLQSLHQWMQATKREFENLQEKDLFKYIAHLQKKGDAPSSLNRKLHVCGIYYRYCFEKELPKNMSYKSVLKSGHYDSSGNVYLRHKRRGPIPRVKMPEVIVDPLGDLEVKAILSTAKRYRDVAIILLMLMCGLRAAEVLSLQLSNVRFNDKFIKVKGKGRKERIIPLSDEVIRILKKYLDLERADNSNDIFFTTLQGPQTGKAMTYAGLRSLFRYRRLKTKINKAHPHRFRHTFGANMARAGMQLPVLQALMGHSHWDTTLKYIRLAPAHVTESYHQALAKIESFKKC
jgi:site-specific recombinase XerD